MLTMGMDTLEAGISLPLEAQNLDNKGLRKQRGAGAGLIFNACTALIACLPLRGGQHAVAPQWRYIRRMNAPIRNVHFWNGHSRLTLLHAI